jgi:hypothetical protein
VTLDPYSGTAKLVLYALVVLAILGAVARWRYVEAALDDARGEVARLEADASARAKNEELAGAIAAKWRAKDTARTESAGKAKEAVRNAKVPVPDACRESLRPLGAALDGVRSLRSERSAPPARPRVLPRSPTADFG